MPPLARRSNCYIIVAFLRFFKHKHLLVRLPANLAETYRLLVSAMGFGLQSPDDCPN